ncbi:MAG TPA: GNAT family N-acetyltransferase [Thermoanaerobaculia bacterium]|nr:GNAT family N-acetyltransferase [Thermoanaerobaculia bacterium]
MPADPLTWQRDGFEVTTDPARLDLDAIHAFLSGVSYWAAGIPRATLERAIAGSLPFGLLEGSRQVGFARVITDWATFVYLADVYVLEELRGRGLGRFLMDCIVGHPDLQGFRRWALVTRDAHALYRAYGFRPVARPERWMEITNPDPYRKAPAENAE